MMRAARRYSRRAGTRALDDLPVEDELDDVDVQVRVTEAWLAALKERTREDFDADAEDEQDARRCPRLGKWNALDGGRHRLRHR